MLLSSVVLDRESPLFDSQMGYNHATDGFYKKNREQADELHNDKNYFSQLSQRARREGNNQGANVLSKWMTAALEEAEDHNRQAAEYALKKNNAHTAGNELDLHGLYVKEAKLILQKDIGECLRKRQSHLKVIVGRGLHSRRGPKLKPATYDMCKESGLKHYIDPINPGLMVIDFAKSSNYQIPSRRDTTPSGHQQHQYQQQNNEQQQGLDIKTGSIKSGNMKTSNIKTGNIRTGSFLPFDARFQILLGWFNIGTRR